MILVLSSILVVDIPVVSRLIPAVSAVLTPSVLIPSTVAFRALTSTPSTVPSLLMLMPLKLSLVITAPLTVAAVSVPLLSMP